MVMHLLSVPGPVKQHFQIKDSKFCGWTNGMCMATMCVPAV